MNTSHVFWGICILTVIVSGLFYITQQTPNEKHLEAPLTENSPQPQSTPPSYTTLPSNTPQQEDPLPYTYTIKKESAQYSQTCTKDSGYQGVARIEIEITSEKEVIITHGGIQIHDTQGSLVGFLGDSSIPRMYTIHPNETTTVSFSYVFTIPETPGPYTVTFLSPYIKIQDTPSLPLYEWDSTVQEIEVPDCNS